MNLYMFCGKGGVGKTNSAVAYALHLAETGHKTAIVDYDGGISVKNTLGLKVVLSANTIHKIRPNLSLATVESFDFIGIMDAKSRRMPLKSYLSQFPGDYGLIPFADMINAFFGVPTDVSTLQKFMTLVGLFLELEEKGFQYVVIDVEPTTGLERLLSNAHAMVQSLINLKTHGVVRLAVIGAVWPDIKGYLKGDYIQHADLYTSHIERVVSHITGATYLIVSTPEDGPVSQTTEVSKIIRRFGGQIRGYVLNNLRGELHEAKNIARIENHGLPIIRIKRRHELHTASERIPILLKIGNVIAGIM